MPTSSDCVFLFSDDTDFTTRRTLFVKCPSSQLNVRIFLVCVISPHLYKVGNMYLLFEKTTNNNCSCIAWWNYCFCYVPCIDTSTYRV